LLGLTGSGKSSLAGQIAFSVAEEYRRTGTRKVVRIFSTDSDIDVWHSRIACHRSQVPHYKLMRNLLTEDELDRYSEALETTAKYPIEFIDTVKSVKLVENAVRYNSILPESKHSNCGFWILDNLHALPHDNFMQLGQMADDLSDLARDVASGLVVYQMNNQHLMRESKMPVLTDIMGGTSLPFSARVVMAVHRPLQQRDLTPEQVLKGQPATIEVIKANNGPMGIADMFFIPASTHWYEA
jgi:replicative DNA helicase